MAHYAKVLNGKVMNVIAAEQDFIDTFVDDSPGNWIQTSYNTYGGKHYTEGVLSKDQSKALRKNFASIGGNYDKTADAFYAAQPHASWTLDSTKYEWEAPTAYPSDGKDYSWNETDKSWDEVE